MGEVTNEPPLMGFTPPHPISARMFVKKLGPTHSNAMTAVICISR